MKQYIKNLGKVAMTAEGAWSIDKDYSVLSVVYDEHTEHGFLSRCEVPAGVDLYNKEYWMPLNVSGYVDSNIIMLSNKINDAQIQSYTLKEAITSIAPVGRKPGTILGFYNQNVERLDIGGCWELWQFNDTNIYNWENVGSWTNIYYNYNKFVGWYRGASRLNAYIPIPEIGMYAYVGDAFGISVIYRCDVKGSWTQTSQVVKDFAKIIIDGTVTVGPNGNWYNDGVDTGIKAKGDDGVTPILRINDNRLEVSYDDGINYSVIIDSPVITQFKETGNKLYISVDLGKTWVEVSDYIAAWFRWSSTDGNIGQIQISRDRQTWENLSDKFANNLHIKKYIGVDEELPTNEPEGTIYAKGPYYSESDVEQVLPKYRLWIYAWKDEVLGWIDNGEFQSIPAGIVQERGDDENVVMSQAACTREFQRKSIDVTEEEWIRIFTEGSWVEGVEYNVYGEEYEV